MFSVGNIANMGAVGDCDAIFGVSAVNAEVDLIQVFTMQTGTTVCTIVTAVTIFTIAALNTVITGCEVLAVETEAAVFKCKALFDSLFF